MVCLSHNIDHTADSPAQPVKIDRLLTRIDRPAIMACGLDTANVSHPSKSADIAIERTVFMTPYIPTSDAALDVWAANFSTLITTSPASYGIASTDAVNIAALVAAYHAQYLLAGMSGSIPKTPVNPATRTPVTIAAKDSTKGAMLPILREYAVLINANQAVTNDQRRSLGLTIKKTTPTPIPDPVSSPIVSMIAAVQGAVQFGLRDSLTPTVRAKPFGAIAAQVFVNMGTVSTGNPSGDPASSPSLSDYVDIATKTPFSVPFAGEDAGRKANIWTRWITRTGLVGPWSDPVAFVIPSGGT